MVKKYFIFDRFDFLCRLFSRFFYNELFLVVRKFTRSSSDKPVASPFISFTMQFRNRGESGGT